MEETKVNKTENVTMVPFEVKIDSTALVVGSSLVETSNSWQPPAAELQEVINPRAAAARRAQFYS